MRVRPLCTRVTPDVWRDGSGRGKRQYTKTERLFARLVFPFMVAGLWTDVEFEVATSWSDGQEDEDTKPTPKPHRQGKPNCTRCDWRFSALGERHYFHRLVAFAYGNTPGLTWEEYGELKQEGGEWVHVWEADHTDGRTDCALHTKVEVVTREENRRRQAARAAAKKAGAAKRAKVA